MVAFAETDINRDSDGDGLRWENRIFEVCVDPIHAWGFYNTFRDHVDDLDDDNDGVLDIYDDDDDGDGIRDREASFRDCLLMYNYYYYAFYFIIFTSGWRLVWAWRDVKLYKEENLLGEFDLLFVKFEWNKY